MRAKSFSLDGKRLAALMAGGVRGVEGTNERIFPETAHRAGLSTHRSHEFFKAQQVQDAFEIIHQGDQAPFSADFLESFQSEVRVAHGAFDGAERMFG